MKTQTPEQFTVSCEALLIQPWTRVQLQVDAIHLVCSAGIIMSNQHLHTVENSPEKSRVIKYGDWIYSAMVPNKNLNAIPVALPVQKSP